ALRLSRSVTKSSRGTRPIASRTRPSVIPRPASCSSTIIRRSPARSDTGRDARPHGGRRLHPEMGEREWSKVGNARIARQRRALEARGEHRHRRVAGEERAVAPPTGVVAAAEVRELPPLRGGDDHFAGIRARERAPDALERVRVLVRNEAARVSRGRPAALVRSEADLVAVFARNRLAVLEEEREVDGSNAVEP